MAIESIYVFGLGAAGSNLALHLLYNYPALNMTIIDDDIVESRNVEPGTQIYEKTDLKRPKVQAFQRIAMAKKNKRITSYVKRIKSQAEIKDIVKDLDKSIVIDAFDNAESRNLFIDLKTNVVHVGFSAMLSGEVVWDKMFTPMEASKKDSEIDVCEMSLARPFIFALTSMASISISRFIEKNEKVNLYIDSQFKVLKWT